MAPAVTFTDEGTRQFLTYWYKALNLPEDQAALALTTNNVRQLKADLYKARTIAGDPDLWTLCIETPWVGATQEIWIKKKTRPVVDNSNMNSVFFEDDDATQD